MKQKYLEQIRKWQQEKDLQLREPDGWLTLVGLYWLTEGEQSIGSSSKNDIQFPEGTCPQEVGFICLENNEVFITLIDDQATINGEFPAEKVLLLPDVSGTPSIVATGKLTFYVIEREDLIGIRVKQESSGRRTNFKGRQWMPTNPDLNLKCKYTKFSEPKIISIPNVLGQIRENKIEGKLVFEWKGEKYSLVGLKLADGSFSIIFNDASCKTNSYPSGRFLITEPIQDDGTIFIDFNKAYNPPCAFSDFATCPLPPKENVLPFEVIAGEKYIQL